MSSDVQILPQTLINKIAAGEVIVRPASVVKELVENSFDAGARHIRVEVSADGRSITVTDDGRGMNEANAKRALLRNSTSKIRDFEDLEHLITRGFRGEALASIISISRFELLTRQKGEMAGTRIVAEGGAVQKVQPTGAAEGTTINVRELFYNTPARLKFLKSPRAEFNFLLQILIQQALSHADTGMTCVRDGATRFDLPAGQDRKTRIEDLLGATVQGQLIAVDYERDGFAVRGFVCRPEASRKDRRWQYLMVNGRPIGAKQLSFPIQEAYHGLLMKQRFPIVILDLQMDPSEVDVNVHPTKEEVRFEEERKVAGLLHRAVNQALLEQNLIPTLEMPGATEPLVEPGNGAPVTSPPPTSAPPISRPNYAPSAGADGDPSIPFVFSPQGVTPYSPGSESLPQSPRPTGPTRDFLPPRTFESAEGSSLAQNTAPFCEGPPLEAGPLESPRGASLVLGQGPPPIPLGQVARTYIMAEWGDDLLLVDQHAAHERLIYQQLLSRPKTTPPRQPLLIPIPLEISTADSESLEIIVPLLSEMGVDVEKSEEGAFSVSALPVDFDSLDAPALVRDMLDEIEQAGPKLIGLEDLRDRVLIRMACHAAIKGGQRLHLSEMKALLSDMAEAKLSFTCPHGRPTMVLLRKDQLDRQFGRIVG